MCYYAGPTLRMTGMATKVVSPVQLSTLELSVKQSA